ncbi:MAG: hypothetical protein QJR09_03245 [Micrococcus sp.]|nr:hypothetical protein [Micrococcus sp.]
MNMVDGDTWWQYAPPFSHFEDFADGLTGWTPRWANTTAWSAANGEAVLTGAVGRRLLTLDALGTEADVEIVARVKYTTADARLKSGLAVRASGEAGNETGYIIGLMDTKVYLARFVNGAYADVANAPATHSAGAYSWLRLRVEGTSIRVRAWADGATEPDTWGIDMTATTIPGAGWAGLFGSSDMAQQWDIVGITAEGGTAPKAA